MNKLFMLLFVVFLYSCKSTKPFTLEMKEQLKIMLNEDQEIQKLMMDGSITNRDSLKNRKVEIFKKNYVNIKNYFENYGFPGIKENGSEVSHFFWIIVQHCDNDVEFQKAVLKEMKNGIKSKNVDKLDFAYLYDRVQINKGRKQCYGTQMSFDSKNGKPYPKNLKNPANVNKRRLEIGLGSIETYIEEIADFQKR